MREKEISYLLSDLSIEAYMWYTIKYNVNEEAFQLDVH